MKNFTKIFASVMAVVLLTMPISTEVAVATTLERATVTAPTYAANVRLSKPSLSSVKKSGSTGMKVKWKKSSGAERYQIYRATGRYNTYKKVKTVSASKRSFTNKSLKRNKRYFYKVRAIKTRNGATYRSSFSRVKSAKTKSGITSAEAKKIALKRTGGGRVTKCHIDYDDGIKVYEIEIINGYYEYDIEVKYSNGAIIGFDRDHIYD